MLRVIALAFLLRLAMFVAIGPWNPDALEGRILRADAGLYAAQAERVLDGHLLDATSMKAPGYPLFLALANVASGHRLHLTLLFQCAVGAWIAGLAYTIGARLYERRVGLVAGIIVAVDSASILIANSLLSDTLFTLLILLAVLAALRARGDTALTWPLLSGVLFAMSALARPLGAPLAFLAIPAVVTGGLPLRRRAARLAALLSPWIAGGAVWLLRGAELSGLSDATRLVNWYLISLSETEPAVLLRGVVGLFFESGSSLFAELLGQSSERVVILRQSEWSGWGGLVARAMSGRGPVQLSFLLYTVSVLCAVYAGVPFALRLRSVARPLSTLLLPAAVALYLVLISAIWGTMRYRVPIIPLLAVYSAAGWSVLGAWWRRRKRAD